MDNKGGPKSKGICQYCLRILTKRHLKKHEAICVAANMVLPEGYRVLQERKKDQHLLYSCPCGYVGRRYRIFYHISRCKKISRPQSIKAETPEPPDQIHTKIEDNIEKADEVSIPNSAETSKFEYLKYVLHQLEFQHQVLRQKIDMISVYVHK